ncbi:metallophosphoesterase [Methylobacterium planeticum]|uniref:Metallophosphoesterase n=1 Tax=Methylobacterium planeticum TaxID=2615211 RepID=A0A6N6MPK3_9HYPH|nr:metallophosphoesterase [Methylobacterium planeticum]KAB1071148.1 metallophosphoesterase [Methylobacterium planeticum]
MAVTWFVSDTHFSHRGILSDRMDRPRPFASIEEHDEVLISRWNDRIREDDIVWHLGDFAYGGGHQRAREIFDRLRGRKFLVVGNHEAQGLRLPWAAQPVMAATVHVQDPGMPKAQAVYLAHCAHRVWPGMHRGDLHLYGHSHGSLPGTASSCDVGVDCWDWRPVRLREIQEVLAETAAKEAGAAAKAALAEAA